MNGCGDFLKQGHTEQSKELEFMILLSHSFQGCFASLTLYPFMAVTPNSIKNYI